MSSLDIQPSISLRLSINIARAIIKMCGRRRAYYSMVLASQNLNWIPRSRVTPWKSDDNYNVEKFMAAVMTLNENFVGGVISDHAIMMSRLRVYCECVTQNGAKELWQFSGHQYTCCSIQDLFWMELQLNGEKRKITVINVANILLLVFCLVNRILHAQLHRFSFMARMKPGSSSL